MPNTNPAVPTVLSKDLEKNGKATETLICRRISDILIEASKEIRKQETRQQSFINK